MTLYKNNDKISYRGVTYRYNKAYGEFRRVEKMPTKIHMPATIQQTSTGNWEAGPYQEEMPVLLLEAWVEGQIEMHERELEGAKRQLADARRVLRDAKARDLKR